MTAGREVLLVDQATSLGGGQTALLNLVDAYTAAGYTPSVLAPLGGAIEPMLRERLGSPGRLLSLKSNRIEAEGRLHWVAERVVQSCMVTTMHARDLTRFSLVHVNGPRLFLPVWLLTAFAPATRVLYHVHLDHKGVELQALRLIRRTRARMSFLAPSRFIENRLHARVGSPESRLPVRLLENCLTPELSRLPFRTAFPRPLQDVAIVGSLSARKGTGWVPEVAQALPGLRFHLIGPVAPGSEEFVGRLRAGCPENVLFHGPSTDVTGLYSRLGVQVTLAISEWPEAFGLSLIEGAARSTYCIARNTGALPEVAAPLGAPVVESPAALIATLNDLALLAPDQLAELTASQHRVGLRHYSFASYVRRLEEAVR